MVRWPFWVSGDIQTHTRTHTRAYRHVCRHSWFSYTALAVCRLTTILLPAALTAKQSTEAHRALSSMTRWSILVHTTAEHVAAATAIPGPTSPVCTNKHAWMEPLSHQHKFFMGDEDFFFFFIYFGHTHTQTLKIVFLWWTHIWNPYFPPPPNFISGSWSSE